MGDRINKPLRNHQCQWPWERATVPQPVVLGSERKKWNQHVTNPASHKLNRRPRRMPWQMVSKPAREREGKRQRKEMVRSHTGLDLPFLLWSGRKEEDEEKSNKMESHRTVPSHSHKENRNCLFLLATLFLLKKNVTSTPREDSLLAAIFTT